MGPMAMEKSAIDRLESWKEIAAYLKRDVRTVQRWEKRDGLPVYRDAEGSLATISASRSEIDAWRDARYRRTHRPHRRLLWLGTAAGLLAGIAGLVAWRTSGSSGKAPTATAARRLQARGVTFLYDGSLSPDGRYLATRDADSNGLLVFRDLATGRSRSLRSGFRGILVAAVFSPDGKQLACSLRFPDWFTELRVMGIDGSQQRLLYRDLETILRVRHWSPDGRFILATAVLTPKRKVQLVRVSVADGSVRVLADMGRDFPVGTSFSPDGRYVAYDIPPRDDVLERDLYIVPVDGGPSVPLVEHPADDFFLGWSPDGRQILFGSDRTGLIGCWILPVSQGRAQGLPKLVRPEMGRINPIGFTRDGAFYYKVSTGGRDVYTAAIEPATGRAMAPPTPLLTRYAAANFAPAWSPDGRFLAFIWELPEEWERRSGEVVIRNVETGAERRLSPRFSHMYQSIHWSRDGRFLYVPAVDKNQNGLFRVDVQTGQVTDVVRVAGYLTQVIEQGIPTPDGRFILYKVTDPEIPGARLVRRDLATGRETILYRGKQPVKMDLSPDGRQLALSTPDGLHIMPPKGGPLRQVAAIPRIADVTWMHDGRYLLFSKPSTPAGEDNTTEVWRIPAEGGAAENLGVTVGWSSHPHLRCHPDGRRIAFAAGANMAEVWTLEKFLP